MTNSSLMDLLTTIQDEISRATGRPVELSSRRHLGGGSINETLMVSGKTGDYFVKLNRPGLIEMFAAETAGLQQLAAAGNIRVPDPVCHGNNSKHSWLVLEYIELGAGSRQSYAAAGHALANLHRNTQPQFGWHRQNTIGSTPQLNSLTDSWIVFWKTQRLEYQLNLAKQNGYRGNVIKQVERLINDCDPLFNHEPQASLLHGDLWSGNLSFDHQGQPVIYDPAVYYGDRETDLAMTELFGGFGSDFYAAYRETWPMATGYAVRKVLYNLYHVLNHMNLFGGSYQNQAESMTSRLLSELG